MAAHTGYPRTRLFVEPLLALDKTLVFSGKQHHYLAHVLRARRSDQLALFNGRDGEWRAVIESVTKRDIAARITEYLRGQPAPSSLTLAFAPIKATDVIAQKATELGVGRLQPVMARHTTVKRINLERLRDNAIEAAEQCERLDIPVIASSVDFPDFLGAQAGALLYGDESGVAEPIGSVIQKLEGEGLTVLVGPEGGFAAEELTALRAAPFAYGASLGPRILRADTAAIAMLAIVQAQKGDWQARPAFRSMAQVMKCNLPH